MNPDTSLQEFFSPAELRETHISQVFLTEESAYKIKKPCKFPFLDYSTLEARHAACLAELELNRRFSHDIYRDVLTITRDAKGLAFQGTGEVVDYAVWMRRIPDACLMDEKLRNQTLGDHDKERLISHLTACYSRAPHEVMDGQVYLQRLHRLIDENRTSLYELAVKLEQDPTPWLACCSRQLLFLQVFRSLLFERAEQGHVIEGHGDLRPEHVVFEDRVSLIDGIEFNRDLRVLDQADELSFLAMECSVMGFPGLGRTIRQRVLAGLQDAASSELLAFYESYRALVRAKVNMLKAEQQDPDSRVKTLKTVTAYQKSAHESIKIAIPAFTFLVAGAMGSGKTTFARALKKELGAVHWESDHIRQEVFGKSEKDHAYGAGPYTQEARLRVYEILRDRMHASLQCGMNVIVDASFSSPEAVRMLVDTLEQEHRPYAIVVCECSDEEAMARIRKRREEGRSLSEARPELYREQKKQGDWSFAGYPHIRINTEEDQTEALGKFFSWIAHNFESNAHPEAD